MAKIHPSAVLEGDVQLADDVVVGPHCVIFGTVGPVKVGAGSVLVSGAHLHGPLTMGQRNTVYPGACLGFAPQDVGFDVNSPGSGAVVGNDNRFREGFTLHRGKTTDPTRIGNSNYFMANSHIGHDSVVENNCVLANGALVAGHVHIADRVFMAGNTIIHQFVRIGRGAMISGGGGVALDLPPWFMCTSINLAGSVNVVGLRRNGFTSAQITTVRWVYRTLYRSGGTPQQALPLLDERADDPLVAEYVAFIRSSKRGIAHGAGRATRGTGAAAAQRSADSVA